MVRTTRLLSCGAALATMLSFAGVANAAKNYALDTGHTEIRFLYDHVGLSTQSGEFRDFEGTLVFDQENLANSKVDVTIRTASVDSGVKALDKHLRSADLFDVEKFPTITFKSTEIIQTGAKRGRVIGDLTIKGKTHPVAMDVVFNFDGPHPLAPFINFYAGANYVAFSARGSVIRSDFDLGFGSPLTSDKIDIVIETELRGTE